MKYHNIHNNFIRRIFGSKKNLLILWSLIVVFAKIIRYTVLKVTLVDAGIGHSMLTYINSHNTSFLLFDSGGSSVDTTGNATFFFDKLNFMGLSSYVSFEIVITICWNILLMLLMRKCVERFNDLQTFFLIVSILALNIFDFTLAKEPIQILFFIFIFYVLESRRSSIKVKLILSVSCILLSVLTFRAYYILLLIWAFVFALMDYFFMKKKVNLKTIIMICVAIVICYIIMMTFLQKTASSSYLEIVRVRTRQSSATTDIRALFDSENIVLFSINYVLVLLRIMFPIELIRFGIKFVIYVGVQIIMSLVYFRSLFNIRSLNQCEIIALYLFSGFILMSAFFEPDFGSWIRHEVAAFPLLLILSGVTKLSYFTGQK